MVGVRAHSLWLPYCVVVMSSIAFCLSIPVKATYKWYYRIDNPAITQAITRSLVAVSIISIIADCNVSRDNS